MERLEGRERLMLDDDEGKVIVVRTEGNESVKYDGGVGYIHPVPLLRRHHCQVGMRLLVRIVHSVHQVDLAMKMKEVGMK